MRRRSAAYPSIAQAARQASRAGNPPSWNGAHTLSKEKEAEEGLLAVPGGVATGVLGVELQVDVERLAPVHGADEACRSSPGHTVARLGVEHGRDEVVREAIAWCEGTVMETVSLAEERN